MSELTRISLVGVMFIIVGTLVAAAVARADGEPMLVVLKHFAIAIFIAVGLAPIALGMAFALYTFIPILVVVPIWVAWYLSEPQPAPKPHTRPTIPERYRRHT